MGLLVEEVQLWNSPSLGAYLLWKFTTGYCNAHSNGDAPIALLHFIAIPILTSNILSEPISDRRKNLQSYINSFEDLKNSDILLSLQSRIKNKLKYTLDAIDIAISYGLLYWDIENGKLYPGKNENKVKRGRSLKPSVVKFGNRAEILGKWFAEHSIASITSHLKVVL